MILTEYSQRDDFDTTFGGDLFDPPEDITFYDAVWVKKDGGVNKLA